MTNCRVCEKEFDQEDLIIYELNITSKKGEEEEDYIEPIEISICEGCSRDETNVFNAFLRDKFFKDFVYTVWYEDEEKGLIKSKDGDWWFSYKDAIETAKEVAKNESENVLIQKGDKVWKINPNGNKMENKS